MRAKRILKHSKRRGKNRKAVSSSIQSIVTMTLAVVLVLVIAMTSRFSDSEKNEVFAASENKGTVTSYGESVDFELPTGIAGVASGVSETLAEGATINRIGTSCEQVVVGQRVQTVEGRASDLNMSTSMENTVNNLDSAATTMAANPKMMSDTDYNTLLRIVEAEAGGEDIKGRILVANVIMNRVKHEEFPDTVTEVVWEYKNGVPQFSPTYDGRINTVTVSDETREAVKQVLEGVDYSEGALFFLQKSAAEAHNVEWFEENLISITKHGVHEFYRYPTDAEAVELEKAREKKEKESNVVQMVKNDVA